MLRGLRPLKPLPKGFNPFGIPPFASRRGGGIYKNIGYIMLRAIF